jgi:hypothetical protein
MDYDKNYLEKTFSCNFNFVNGLAMVCKLIIRQYVVVIYLCALFPHSLSLVLSYPVTARDSTERKQT